MRAGALRARSHQWPVSIALSSFSFQPPVACRALGVTLAWTSKEPHPATFLDLLERPPRPRPLGTQTPEALVAAHRCRAVS